MHANSTIRHRHFIVVFRLHLSQVLSKQDVINKKKRKQELLFAAWICSSISWLDQLPLRAGTRKYLPAEAAKALVGC
jgi:hypothetical protein